MTQKLGSELREGDTIKVWWRPGVDRITQLRPYSGSLAHIFPKGAQFASFALLKTGMTIENNHMYDVL